MLNPSQAPEQTLGSLIARIAAALGSENFPTGDLAKLRRMNPASEQPLPLAFYRFALRYLPQGWDRPETRRDWVTLVSGIAILSPGAHNANQGLGKTLAETGYSEARLERLLSSSGMTRRILFLRAVRFLRVKGAPFDWRDAAHLLLTHDPEKLEDLHRRIAGDFYRYQKREGE